MNTYETLKIETENNILLLTLSRPKALNAINQKMMSELGHFFETEVPKLKLSGIIITGDGEKSFVAGADISEFLGLDAGNTTLSKAGHDVFNAIEACKVPVIAAVNGFALGGGCEIAMACHMRVASANARFGTPEVNLGLIPGFGGTQRMVQLLGKGKGLELLMTADIIDANTALQLGLANYVVEAGEEINKSKEILNKIAQKAPLAISKIIDSVNAYYDKTKDGYETEIENFGSLTHTSDFKEGATAFLEKRKAVFTGK